MVRKKVIGSIAGCCAAAVAAAIGHGIFTAAPAGPAAASGLERQIASGEKVSAATRARVPSPAATARSHGRGNSTVPRLVSGARVTAIGDSVMAASATALRESLPGIYIDALPSRQWAAGLDVIRSLAGSGALRPVVVVGLGTNYIVTVGQLRELIRLLGPDRRLVLINTYVPDTWSQQVNATEAAFVRTHPRIVMADWYDLIRSQTNLLWPDQIHPMIAGTKVYARMVYQAVQATRQVALASDRR